MDPSQWLTRGDAARHLGVYVSTVRRLEARGELVPKIEEEGGLRYFTLWQVLKLKEHRARKARNRAAEMRVAAFELFQDGVDWRDVAIRLRYDPLALHGDRHDSQQRDVVPRAFRATFAIHESHRQPPYPPRNPISPIECVSPASSGSTLMAEQAVSKFEKINRVRIPDSRSSGDVVPSGAVDPSG
jgi:DNA-binding transcriptional MerR regulator